MFQVINDPTQESNRVFPLDHEVSLKVQDRFKDVKKEKHYKASKITMDFKSYNLYEHLENEEEQKGQEEKDEEEEVVTLSKNDRKENKIERKCDNDSKKKIDKRNEKVTETNQKKTVSIVEDKIIKRCPSCHVGHFPLPKFCRWWQNRQIARKTQIKQICSLEYDDLPLVRKCIEFLESKLNGRDKRANEIIANNFFNRSEDSSNPNYFPDMFNSNKLRGGCCSRKVAIKSENKQV